jgi:hypothetical protein
VNTTSSESFPVALAQIPALLRGEPRPLRAWIAEWRGSRAALYAGIIVAGTAAFGMAVGLWRDPLQAFFTAIKFPIIVLLTALGNGLLNGLLAPLLGTNIGFRQSLLAVLMSFTIASAVLGACSPLVAYLIWNAPPLSAVSADSRTTHSFILVTVVAVIALAGTVANLRLLQLLRQLSGSPSSARRTMFAWLAGNLLLGSQISWVLRPFVGSPTLPVQFMRGDAWQGSFFESVFRSLQRLLS